MKSQKKKLAKRSPKPQDYRKFNGYTYERLEHGVDVEVELEVDVLARLDKLVSDGKYLSRGDAVRDILRQMIREKTQE